MWSGGCRSGKTAEQRTPLASKQYSPNLAEFPRVAQRDEESKEDGPVTQLEKVLLSLIGKGQANPVERQRSKRGPRIET